MIDVRNGRGPFSRCSHKTMIRWGLGVGSEKIRNTDRALDDGGDHSACPHFCSGRLLRRPELRPTLQAGDVPETGNADKRREGSSGRKPDTLRDILIPSMMRRTKFRSIPTRIRSRSSASRTRKRSLGERTRTASPRAISEVQPCRR